MSKASLPRNARDSTSGREACNRHHPRMSWHLQTSLGITGEPPPRVTIGSNSLTVNVPRRTPSDTTGVHCLTRRICPRLPRNFASAPGTSSPHAPVYDINEDSSKSSLSGNSESCDDDTVSRGFPLSQPSSCYHCPPPHGYRTNVSRSRSESRALPSTENSPPRRFFE